MEEKLFHFDSRITNIKAFSHHHRNILIPQIPFLRLLPVAGSDKYISVSIPVTLFNVC